jgi:hypothetical protein
MCTCACQTSIGPIGFYRDALGLGLTADGREAGLDAAFLAAGD